MKHFILLFFVFLYTSNSFSQETLFTEIQKNESAVYPLLGISEVNETKSYFVATHHEKNESYSVIVTLYDSSMIAKNKASHQWTKSANDKIQFLGATVIRKKHFSLFSKITESTLTNELVLLENDNGVITEKSLDKYEIKSLTNTGAYKITFSPNGKTMLVMKESLIEKGKNEGVTFQLYDEGFTKFSDLSLSFTVMSKPNPVNKAFITNKGDVFLIKKDREKTEYKFYLYAYNADLKGWNQKQINIPGKMISDIDATLNSSQEFIVAGFYNTIDVSSYQGYFYYRFDASLKFASKINNNFTAEFMTNFIGKKAAAKEDAVISGYWFENLIAAPDNNIYLVAEKEEFEELNGIEKNKYGDILYMQLDKEGTVKNSGMLKNKQETENDKGEWSSFNYASVKDTLHIFHNEVNPSDSKSKFTDATFAGTYHSRLYTLNTSDTKAATEMILKGDTKLAFYPEYVYQTSDNFLIYLLLSKDKTGYALGKVRLR